MMSVRPHEIITTPDSGASALSREGLIRRRFERRLRLLRLPEDLTGWTVLDIGAWHGYFSFECERRGAERVLAVDSYAWNRFGMDEFLAAKSRLGSNVEHREVDVHDLDVEDFGQFDLVLMLGVFYHLRNPLAALDRVRRVTRRLLICETPPCCYRLCTSGIRWFRSSLEMGKPMRTPTSFAPCQRSRPSGRCSTRRGMQMSTLSIHRHFVIGRS